MRIMQKYSNSICFALYVAGIAWFGILVGFSELQTKTYFSENALLPGKFNRMLACVQVTSLFNFQGWSCQR